MAVPQVLFALYEQLNLHPDLKSMGTGVDKLSLVGPFREGEGEGGGLPCPNHGRRGGGGQEPGQRPSPAEHAQHCAA